MIGPAAVLRTRPDVRYRIVEGKAVLILQDAAEVLMLNEVGSRVLGLLDARAPVEAVLDRMAEEFAVDRADLQRDVLAFLQELTDTGILEEVQA